VGIILHMIAATLAAARPNAAAIIHAAEAYVAGPPILAELSNSIMTEALSEEHARELRARGADMDWDQAVAYTLTQTSQALSEFQSATQA
jgi:hypothetical protein